MALTSKQLSEIKIKIQEFLNNNGFDESEEHTQAHYILPILEILGWKSHNVIINKTQDVKTGKRPDILLKGSGGGTIFVIESKEPSVKKGLDGEYPKIWTFAEQISSYCGAEGVSWGLLTNFQEWRICNPHSLKTNGTYYKTLLIFKDKKIVCSDEKLKEFFELVDYTFLNPRKGKISLDNVYYKKQEEIKEDFFQSLKTWRADLRSSLRKNNSSLSIDEIDYQTQRILDRLIFIDFCYDKGIISQDYLGKVLFSKANLYNELKKIFIELNEKFNSEIFAKDKCDNFSISDDISEPIIKGINIIDFSLLNVHIIGEVYENYLGELLKEGKNKIASVESKEHLKRKSHGIFYTPDYIVNFIIENTVGELLKKCKTVKEIEKIKIIDPACGSGSFLIRAFDVFYDSYKKVTGNRTLDTLYDLEIRKKILLHNLYGVDLDEKAIEIAKLNLLLRGLEGLPDLDRNIHDRKILPNLSLNIRCGNSLISGEYEHKEDNDENQLSLIFDKGSEYKENLKKLTELKEEFYLEEDNLKKDKLIDNILNNENLINKYLNSSLGSNFKDIDKLKPFNFEVAFCEVMNPKYGGFDCVIGNPPFVQLSSEKSTTEGLKRYLLKKFKSSMGRLNTFGFFTKKGMDLLNSNGYFGYIIPNTITTQDYYEDLRAMILKECNIKSIVMFDKLPFKDAVVENVILVLEKKEKSTASKSNKISIIEVDENINFNLVKNISQKLYEETPKHSFNVSFNVHANSLKNKIENLTKPLGTFMEINQAIALKSDRAKWVSDKKKNSKYKPLLVGGRNIGRYSTNWDGTYLHYDLNGIHSCKREDIFLSKEKIFFQRVSSKLIATLDTKKFYGLHTLVVMNLNPGELNIRFFLGIFNSKLMNYYYRITFASTKTVFAEIGARQVKQLPIKTVNLKNDAQKKIHDKISELVDELLELSKSLEKNENKIKITDLELDNLVYKLYNISSPEQKIIDDFLSK